MPENGILKAVFIIQYLWIVKSLKKVFHIMAKLIKIILCFQYLSVCGLLAVKDIQFDLLFRLNHGMAIDGYEKIHNQNDEENDQIDT